MKAHFKIITPFSLFLFITQSYYTQTTGLPPGQADDKIICGTEVPTQQWESALQDLIKQTLENKGAGKAQAQVYTIPVIVHIIHGGQPVGTYPNLAQGQINSQIQVLNDDYGGIGYNSGNYPSTAFSTYAAAENLPQANIDNYGRVRIANCGIQFCLATTDTSGNLLPEPGIDRINYVSKGWANPGSFNSSTSFQNYMNGTVKPQTIWNVSKYLNIWVSAIGNNSSLLGYATFPPLTNLNGLSGFFGTDTTDGFWCLARAFGSQGIYPQGTYQNGYTRGRTSTHEIGHYLGLRHTWGDGICATDFCDDTPPAYTSNFGSPSYPLNAAGNNTCFSAVNGSMFMNFMDYTNDPVKYMFTPDQATRIQTAMANSPYRKFLGSHNLCSLNSVAATAQFNMPPVICDNEPLLITNTSAGTPVPDYTWTASGGAVFNPNNNVALPNISFPSSGTYTITLSVGNGTTSSTSRTITVNPSPTLIFSVPSSVCLYDDITIAAGGADVFYWYPVNTSGAVLQYKVLGNETFTCTGIFEGCESTATVSVLVNDCTGMTTIPNVTFNPGIYPNPADDHVYLKDLPGTEIKIEITDASGRIVLKNDTSVSSDKSIRVTIGSLAKGIYLIRIISKEEVPRILKLVKE